MVKIPKSVHGQEISTVELAREKTSYGKVQRGWQGKGKFYGDGNEKLALESLRK